MDPRQIVSIVQASVFFVAGISLVSIWKIGPPRQPGDESKETSRESSIIFLAIACFIWTLMALLQYRQSEASDALKLPSLFRTLLSTVNTAFIVGVTAGLDVFEKSAKALQEKLLRRSSFPVAVWILMGICVVIGFIASMACMMFAEGWYASVPDIVISVTTLGFVLVGLYRSFKARGFNALAWLSIVVVGLYIAVQFAELPWLAKAFMQHRRYDDLRWVANLSFKTMLCLLFMALIVSWMYEKAINMSSRQKPYLRIKAPYRTEDKTAYEIEFGYSLDGFGKAELKEKSYLRILEIALKWQQTRQPVQTKDLYHTSDAEVRQDLKETLSDTRVDPLFGRATKGIRLPRVAPADVSCDIDGILSWPSWENADFAKSILDARRPKRKAAGWDLGGER